MSDPVSSLPMGKSTLAIISGGGSLPFALADAAVRSGRRVVLFAVRGSADPERVAGYPHHWILPGQFRRFIRLAAQEGCRDVVFMGSVTRPSLLQMRPDLKALWYIPQIIRMFRGGDGHLQLGVARVFEEHGFRLLAPQEVAPELVMPLGPVGTRLPNERDWADITRGLALLDANSPFDIGQTVIVADNQILAVEGPEGTDQTLARVAALRRDGRIRTPLGVGVMVKAAKIGQDLRFDLPSIGPHTVDGAIAARLAGIAVVAKTSIVHASSQVAAAADRANLFVIGVSADGTRQ